jgi:aspartate kinase
MNDIIVAKFGGSSLADSNQFNKVKEIILADENRKYIVVSAPGKRNENDYKITDLLIKCHNLSGLGHPIHEVFNIIENRFMDLCTELAIDINIKDILLVIKDKISNGASLDYTASRGEYLCAIILAKYLSCDYIDSKDLIVFNENSQLNYEATHDKIINAVCNSKMAVIPGFYGSSYDGRIKTFSRGGSDITGSVIAEGVGASLYENWTDVSGLLMADPRIVDNPKPINKITYKELRELSYMGATVLHEEAIFPLINTNIPINIKNTNSPKDKGTFIVSDLSPVNNTGTITGLAGKKDFTVIAIEKMQMNFEKGFLRKILSILEQNSIAVEHFPTGIDTLSLVIADCELDHKLDKIIQEIKNECSPDSIAIYPNMALVAIVGRGMIRTKGISSKVFNALGKDGINIRMITQGSGELNIIVGIENEDFEKSIQAIYNAFVSKQ